VKAKDRKRAEELLEILPPTKELKKLKWEFDRKGFLSKREMKILNDLSTRAEAAA